MTTEVEVVKSEVVCSVNVTFHIFNTLKNHTSGGTGRRSEVTDGPLPPAAAQDVYHNVTYRKEVQAVMATVWVFISAQIVSLLSFSFGLLQLEADPNGGVTMEEGGRIRKEREEDECLKRRTRSC